MTRRTVGQGSILLVAAVLGGCGEAVSPDSRPGEVVNPAPGEGTVVEAAEVLRVGAIEGDGPEVFGRVAYVGLDAAGRLHVADGMAMEVRVFDRDGRHRFTYGGDGEGPGEFTRVDGIAFHPDGSTWVWAPQQRRFSVYDSAGVHVRDVSREPMGIWSVWPGRFDDEGRLMDIDPWIEGIDQTKMAVQRIRTRYTPLRFAPDLRSADSLPHLASVQTAVGGNYRMPFERSLIFAVAADGTAWFADSHAYRVARRTPAGDTVLAFSVDVPPPAVSNAEIDSVLAEHPATRGPDPSLTPDMVPRTRPAVERILPLGGGWVGVFPWLGRDTGRFLDVFTPDGRHRARVDLGRALALRTAIAVRDGVLYGVSRDDFDVEYLVGLNLGIPELAG